MLYFADYQLDPAQGLKRGRRDVRITPKSLALLYLLAQRAGQVVTKEEIFRLVWPDTAVSDSALTTCNRNCAALYVTMPGYLDLSRRYIDAAIDSLRKPQAM